MAWKNREAFRVYQKEWDKQHYEQYKEEVLARNKLRKKEVADWLGRYKSTLRCIECGIRHPAVLQFHHRDRASKSFNIADVVRQGYGVKRIMSEIEKCDVLCVNCHAKVHWRERYGSDSWEELLPLEEE